MRCRGEDSGNYVVFGSSPPKNLRNVWKGENRREKIGRTEMAFLVRDQVT